MAKKEQAPIQVSLFSFTPLAFHIEPEFKPTNVIEVSFPLNYLVWSLDFFFTENDSGEEEGFFLYVKANQTCKLTLKAGKAKTVQEVAANLIAGRQEIFDFWRASCQELVAKAIAQRIQQDVYMQAGSTKIM